MSRFRRGAVEESLRRLESALAEAHAGADASHEAAVLVNLGTVRRRTGDLDGAARHFEQAGALQEREGLLHALAQTQVLLGGTLREAGELERAAPLLQSCLAIRERLGDAPGSAAARAILGLVHADRGHLGPASVELERSSVILRACGRAADVPMLDARLAEIAARLGRPVPDGVRSERTEGEDPRVAVTCARASWLRGDDGAARSLAEEARTCARRLRRTAALAEASHLLRRLGASAEDVPPTPAGSAPVVDEDEAVLAAIEGGFETSEDRERALATLDRLERRGRDDRAARLALAIAARGADARTAAEAAERARAALERCSVGLAPEEDRALRRSLLAMPDPRPDDLAEIDTRSKELEDLDMEIVKLLEINHRLVQQDDLKDLLGTIVESALSVTGAERGFLVLEEDGELVFDTALDSVRGDIGRPELEISRSIVREALAEDRALRISNASEDPSLSAAPSVSSLELRSILCTPFAIGQGLRGVVYVDNRLREGAFDERAERLLGLLADQAALAIRQTRRLDEIRRLNRELKHDFAAQASDLRTARAALAEAGLPAAPSGLVGSSLAMRRVHALLERSAPSSLPVLVVGASGTGKELAARALHSLSPRARAPFVTENCAALPPSLIEAELFGYKKGAYTGAIEDRPGMFERASGGTLFLDEIGELPLELQAKLLRVLESGEVRRLGDHRVQKVEFRLVVATNRDLEVEVREGRFRADLYYRLDGLRVAMPTLDERLEDVPDLVDHFLRLDEVRSGARKRIHPAVLSKLCRRAWPGNVRELANEIARLCVLSSGDLVDPSLVREPALGRREGSGAGVRTLQEIEREAIEATLERTGGDKRKAAELLGISRAKIYQRLKEWSEQAGDDADGREADATPSPS